MRTIKFYAILLYIISFIYPFVIKASESSSVTFSGTLPVMFINTDNSAPIDSRENYLNASFYIDPLQTGETGYASAISPQTIRIKGRGNSTWTNYDKKPYLFRCDEPMSLLGMPESKEWDLMAFVGYTTAVSNNLAFEIGRKLEMGWQPHMKTIELVLNGEYIGMYYLSETVIVESNRLDIEPQKSEENDPQKIKSGWLIEFDNYADPCQFIIQENDSVKLRVTYHTPNVLSEIQGNWIKDEISGINALVYTENKLDNSWEEYFDVESMAKYFILQELFDNIDGFLGSFFIHKATSENKWICGPLWDVQSVDREKTDFTVYMPSWNGKPFTKNTPHWIWELLKFPHFISVMKDIWKKYGPELANMDYEIDTFLNPQSEALKKEVERWGTGGTIETRKKLMKRIYNYHYEWLQQKMAKTAQSLKIDRGKISLNVGEKDKINVFIEPVDAIDPLVWTSSNPECVYVDQHGNIESLSSGTATISVYFGDYKAECKVISYCDKEITHHDFMEINEDDKAIYYKYLNDTDVAVTYKGTSGEDFINEYDGDINIPSSVKHEGKVYSIVAIDQSTFFECENLTSVSMPNSILNIGDYAFRKCYGLLNIRMSENLKKIGYSSFSYCTRLKSISIGPSVISVDGSAFRGCSKLSDINFNSINCERFGSSEYPAFYGINLKNIEIGYEVKRIPSYMFYQANIEKLVLGAEVKEIGENAFANSSIKSLTLKNKIPPKTEISSFDGIYESCVLYVPYAYYLRYFVTEPWWYFDNILASDSPIKNLNISSEYTRLKTGDKYILSASVEVEDDIAINDITNLMAWYSNDPSVASVDDLGVVTALKSGSAEIYAHPIYDITKTIKCLIYVYEKYGDVNGDGIIDISDISRMVDTILTTNISINEDINGDGQVTVSDITDILDIILYPIP